jgi:hypothetical protein
MSAVPAMAEASSTGSPMDASVDWWRLLGPSPFAQAAFGAVLATLAAPSSGKLMTACVTAAARGAMQGATTAKQADCCTDSGSAIFDLMEQILVAVADLEGSTSKVGVSRCKAILRDLGRPELASALGRMTKGRNSTAHPDWGLLKEVQALKASSRSVPGKEKLHLHDDANGDDASTAGESSCNSTPSCASVVAVAEVMPLVAPRVLWADMTADDTGDEESQLKHYVEQHDKGTLVCASTDAGNGRSSEDKATKRECKLVRDLIAFGVLERDDVLSFDWSPKCLFDSSEVSQKIVGLEDKIGDNDTMGNDRLAAADPDDEGEDEGLAAVEAGEFVAELERLISASRADPARRNQLRQFIGRTAKRWDLPTKDLIKQIREAGF